MRRDKDGNPALIGRQQEAAHLADLLVAARAGQGGALTFVAGAGAGKTALLAEAARQAAESDVLVLRTTGVEEEAALPWAAFATLCLGHVEVIERLPGAQARALRAALALDTAPTVVDRLAVSLGALGLLSAVAAAHPLLLLVDDLQWLDPDSRSGLGFIARRIGNDPIAIVAASREPSPALGQVAELAPLSAEAVEELLRRAGVASAGSRAAVASSAGGNPLLALRLARLLSPEERAGERPPPARLPVPQEIEALYAGQLAELPDATRTALLVLAADLSEDMGVVGRALEGAGVSFDELGSALDAGLVATELGVTRIVHPLARSAIYQSASAAARQAAHAALAQAEGPSSPRGVVHQAGATIGPDAALAAALARQAAAARQRGAPVAAAARWEQAAGRSPDARARTDLLVAAATAALEGGEQRWAAALLDSARAQGEPLSMEGRRAEVRVAIGDGRGEQARHLVSEADADLAAADPAGVAELVGEVARWLLVREPFAAIPLLERVGELAEGTSVATALRGRILCGMAAFLSGEAEKADQLTGCWPELVEAEGPVAAGPFLAETVALYYGYSNQPVRALELLDRLEPRMRVACAPGALLTVMAARCLVAYSLNLRACVAAGQEAITLAEETAQVGLVRVAESVLAIAAGTIGDRAAAEQAAARLLAQDDRMATVAARAALGKLELTLGRVPDALVQFQLIREVVGPTNDTNVYFEPDEAAALVASGDRAGAAALLDAIEVHARSSTWGVGMVERTHALLAEDLAVAERHFAAACEALVESRVDESLAGVELAWGRRLRLAKRRAQARTHLEHAVALYERIGADGAREVAAAELEAAGGSAQRSRPTEELLNTAELHAARLAVAGATNRDIAAQLFLSPRTVENHLSAVYRKLAVNGRAGLLAHAATDPAFGGLVS